jgi:hypothetical protein
LLATKDIQNGYIFATPHPTLDDYLPSNGDGFFIDNSNPRVLGTAAEDSSEPAAIYFPDVAAFPAVVQACYLFGRVMNYIMCHTLPVKQQQAESTFLDRTLQSFAYSLLRQAEGSTLKGHYCTPFSLCLLSVSKIPQA